MEGIPVEYLYGVCGQTKLLELSKTNRRDTVSSRLNSA